MFSHIHPFSLFLKSSVVFAFLFSLGSNCIVSVQCRRNLYTFFGGFVAHTNHFLLLFSPNVFLHAYSISLVLCFDIVSQDHLVAYLHVTMLYASFKFVQKISNGLKIFLVLLLPFKVLKKVITPLSSVF